MKPGFLPPGFHPSMMYGPYGGQPPYAPGGQDTSFQNSSLSSLAQRPALPADLDGLVLSSFAVEHVCRLITTVEGVNQAMVDTYCATITSNNINGRVLLLFRLHSRFYFYFLGQMFRLFNTG